MPTTCGFPNCKFRSRYRGSDDIRHFYRVPKKPSNLRLKWLEAIGRTEETIVSQLRVCSGHFEGGEKKEGDVPVADPATDKPLKVEIPPKIPRNAGHKRKKKEKLNNAIGKSSMLGVGGKVVVTGTVASVAPVVTTNRNNSAAIGGNGSGGKKTTVTCPANTVSTNNTNVALTKLQQQINGEIDLSVSASDSLNKFHQKHQLDIAAPEMIKLISNGTNCSAGAVDNAFGAAGINSFMQSLLAPLLFSASPTTAAAISLLPYSLKAFNEISNGLNNNNNNHIPITSHGFFIDKENENQLSLNHPYQNVYVIDPEQAEWSLIDPRLKNNVMVSEDELLFKVKNISDVEHLIIWEDCRLSNSFLDRLTNIKTILKMGCAVGFVDRDYLSKREISMIDIISPCLEEVCENIFLILLQIMRNDLLGMNGKNNMDFTLPYFPFTKTLQGSTIGIIGGGPLEIAIAKRANVFGAAVIGFDSTRFSEYRWNLGVAGIEIADDLSCLLRSSDVIIMNTSARPLIIKPETFFPHLRSGCCIINLQLSNHENPDLTVLSSYLRSKHIDSYIQNCNKKDCTSSCLMSSNRYCSTTNNNNTTVNLLYPLTDTSTVSPFSIPTTSSSSNNSNGGGSNNNNNNNNNVGNIIITNTTATNSPIHIPITRHLSASTRQKMRQASLLQACRCGCSCRVRQQAGLFGKFGYSSNSTCSNSATCCCSTISASTNSTNSATTATAANSTFTAVLSSSASIAGKMNEQGPFYSGTINNNGTGTSTVTTSSSLYMDSSPAKSPEPDNISDPSSSTKGSDPFSIKSLADNFN